MYWKRRSGLRPGGLVVVCPPGREVSDVVHQYASRAICVVQKKPRGTADALRCALPQLRGSAQVLVLCADTPLLSVAVLRSLQRRAAAAPALLTFIAVQPFGYGRIVKKGGKVERIVEERDATPAERRINEVYAGALALPLPLLVSMLRRIGDNNAAGERYLTDIAALTAAAGRPAVAVCGSEAECAGINTAADLERLTALLRERSAAALLARGVRLADAARLDVRGTVRAGRDVEIDVNVILAGEVTLGARSRIGAHCVLRNCRVGSDTVIAPFSHIEDAVIGARCSLGPYARLRPGTALAGDVHIGNFVEVKNSRLASGSKAGHLTYIGDSRVGAGCNIGAGVITCNYDGRHKHRTVIGDNVFVGSDTQLIAPVKVGKGAMIAAGTTVTQAVPAGMLAISRSAQVNRRRR